MTPSVILAIADGLFPTSIAVNSLYLAIKTISILINIIAYGIIVYKVSSMLPDANLQATGAHRVLSQSSTSSSKYNNPVYVLAMRLQYYVVVQSVTRIGASWYQLQFGYDAYDSQHASSVETVAVFTEAILTPSAGLGYLLVFLHIQPDARKKLNQLMKYSCCYISYKMCVLLYKKQSGEIEDYSVGDLFKFSIVRHSNALNAMNGNGTSSMNQLLINDQANSSLFPLLEMDEEELEREIDRFRLISNSKESIGADPHVHFQSESLSESQSRSHGSLSLFSVVSRTKTLTSEG